MVLLIISCFNAFNETNRKYHRVTRPLQGAELEQACDYVKHVICINYHDWFEHHHQLLESKL